MSSQGRRTTSVSSASPSGSACIAGVTRSFIACFLTSVP